MSQEVENPFYRRIQQDGFRIVVERPSDDVRRKRFKDDANPYAERIKRDGMRIHRYRGRPEKSAGACPTVVKSIRLPPKIWNDVDAQAAREGKNRHAALREAVLIWLRS